jgi:hypothetical protein
MDGELLEKTKSIFGGVFPVWPRLNSSAEKLRNPFGEDADHPSRLGVLAWLRDRRKLLRRYRFLTIAARLDRILYLLAALLWLEQGFCDITLLCIRHKRPFVVTRMSDIKKFTRNAAQQAVRQTFYQLSDFWKQILV